MSVASKSMGNKITLISLNHVNNGISQEHSKIIFEHLNQFEKEWVRSNRNLAKSMGDQ